MIKDSIISFCQAINIKLWEFSNDLYLIAHHCRSNNILSIFVFSEKLDFLIFETFFDIFLT